MKERNRLATENHERERLEAGYGEHEAIERDKAVRISLADLHQCFSIRYFTDIRFELQTYDVYSRFDAHNEPSSTR